MSHRSVGVSIIVPVRNNPKDLQQCLGALQASSYPNLEVLVVDDGSSTDESVSIGAQMGVRVLTLATNLGPSSARNYGARHARGDVLLFVDCDVLLKPDAVGRVVEDLEQDPLISGVFGSYDDNPQAEGLVSQYRNLLHHYVHQHASPEASTFWAGCGAIRRSVFEQVGGFDDKRYSRCIEDIEFGYRLNRAGHRILLDKKLQVTHLKRWTLRSMIRTDVTCRALPWARLIMETGRAPNDLNLQGAQRASVALVALAAVFLLLSPFEPLALVVSVFALLTVIGLNRRLYTFFCCKRGLMFTARIIPLHLAYFLYGGLAYAYAWCEFQLWGPSPTPTGRLPVGKAVTHSASRTSLRS
jgi:GT2 family glycosyltransferase